MGTTEGAVLAPDKKSKPATTFDIVISCIFPFAGVVVGIVALFKGERRRAKTMLIISICLLVVFVIFRTTELMRPGQ